MEREAEWITGMSRKDETALSEVIAAYSPYLVAVVHMILRESRHGTFQDIEEVVQDTFTFIWRYPYKYDQERGTLKNFLAQKAISLAKNRRKKRGRELGLLMKIQETVLLRNEQFFSGKYDLEELIQVILMMEEPSREILIRRFLLEEPPRRIHSETGIPLKEINNRLYFGKQKLKKWKEKSCDEKNE